MLNIAQLRQVFMAIIPLLAALLPAQTIIVDNSSPGFATNGEGWATYEEAVGYVGVGSLRNLVQSGQDKAAWTPNLPMQGYYDVYAWWVAAPDNSPVAPYTINYASGSVTITVNQTLNSGEWNFLGRYPFNAGSGKSVILADSGNPAGTSYVSADAVRFDFVAPVSIINAPTVEIGGFSPCSNCNASILPGTLENDPDTKYFIVSDMPEKFGYPTAGPKTRSDGLLYSTNVLLPQYGPNYPPAPFDVQNVNGFTTIDGNYEVFIFNIAQPGDTSKPRRIIIYAENKGTSEVTIQPKQVIVTDGTIGTVHEMESTLGKKVQEQTWDPQSLTGLAETLTINPGDGQVVGVSKKFAVSGNGQFKSQNLNCFGIVRGIVGGKDPNLVLYVVALDEDSSNVAPNLAAIKSATQTLIAGNIGAPELEDFQFDHEPTGCTLRRSSGVYPHKVFRSNVGFDLETLPGGVTYNMGLDAVRTADCPGLRQTVDALLSPKWLRQESIGNYMVDHRVQFFVQNTGKTPRTFNLEFGKTGADIGLVYQLATGTGTITDAAVDALPAQTQWAGPNQASTFKPLLATPITLKPGEQQTVAIRFQILGNSSTPFQIRIPDQKGPEFDLLSPTPVAGTVGQPVVLQLLASSDDATTPTVMINNKPAMVARPDWKSPLYTATYSPLEGDKGELEMVLESSVDGIAERGSFGKVVVVGD